jgi:replicative DNA helicase
MDLERTDYEQALLGAILIDNRILEEKRITSELFTDLDCLRAFETIEKTKARGARADMREIALMMPDKMAFVCGLSDYGSAANAGFYVDELRDRAKRRGLMRLAREVTERARQEHHETEAILAYCDSELLAINDAREIGYKPVSAYILQTVNEIEAAIASKGALTGIPTGFEGLDELTNGLQKQAMVIIGARPGTGKTSIALNMTSAAVRSGRAVGFFSAEMSAVQIIKRIAADWGSVDHRRIISGIMGNRDRASIAEALEKLALSRVFINDSPSIKLVDLVSDAKRMKRRDGIGVLFVDYLSLVTNENERIPRHEQVAQISKTFKGLARELDIPVVILSQLTREAQGERPKLSQLRDSGSIEQDADMVILLHQLGYEDDTKQLMRLNLIVEKNRSGSTGDIPMLFKPSHMRFTQSEEKWQTVPKKGEK